MATNLFLCVCILVLFLTVYGITILKYHIISTELFSHILYYIELISSRCWENFFDVQRSARNLFECFNLYILCKSPRTPV